jgi:xylulokinase
MAYLLGIDVGTTGTRALLVNEQGQVVAGATEEYPLYTPQPLWAEQDPADWWRATMDAIHQVLQKSGIAPAEVIGVGLTGQMHGVVLLDDKNEVLRPALIWCDQRSQPQCDWITARVGADRLIELTCNPALTGFSAPKILWVRDNEPEVFAQVRKFLLPKDYIRFKLTGEFASEVSDASGTNLFDVRRRKWSDEVVQTLGLKRSILPEVFESPEITGRVTRDAARRTGLPEGVPVVGGGGDQAAGGVGNGVVEPGIVSCTIGSSGVVFAFTEEPRLDPKGRMQTFCHAVPGKWHVMGVTQGAGLSLRWFRDQLGGAETLVGKSTGRDPYELLTEEAAQAEPGSEGLVFLPYLMGERAPHLDPNAKGVFFGLTGRHMRQHMVRSILEGVAFSLRDSLEIIVKEMGNPVTQVRASGGGGRSVLWRQIQADVFGTEMVTINATEGPAYGAALLAAVGAGVHSSVEEACHAAIRVVERTTPDAARSRLYEDYYSIYRALYPALKPSFDRVTAVVTRQAQGQ